MTAPNEDLWRAAGYSPEQIATFREMAAIERRRRRIEDVRDGMISGALSGPVRALAELVLEILDGQEPSKTFKDSVEPELVAEQPAASTSGEATLTNRAVTPNKQMWRDAPKFWSHDPATRKLADRATEIETFRDRFVAGEYAEGPLGDLAQLVWTMVLYLSETPQ